MTGQDMLEAIVYLDPVFIEEADDDMPPIKKMSPIKRWAAIAACLALLLSAGIGSVAAEAKEYKAAMQFFDEYTLPTDGLTRGEIKAVYHDITNKSFAHEKTADVIENSLTPQQKVEFIETKGNAGNKTAEDLWDYKIQTIQFDSTAGSNLSCPYHDYKCSLYYGKSDNDVHYYYDLYGTSENIPVELNAWMYTEDSICYYSGLNVQLYWRNYTRRSTSIIPQNDLKTQFNSAPTEAIRIRTDGTAYAMYDTDTGYRYYIFIDPKLNIIAGQPMVINKNNPLPTRSDFQDIKIGDSIKDVGEIDGVTEPYLHQILSAWESTLSSWNNSIANGAGPLATYHYCKDGILRIEYAPDPELNVLGFIVAGFTFYEDFMVEDFDGTKVNQRILDIDLPNAQNGTTTPTDPTTPTNPTNPTVSTTPTVPTVPTETTAKDTPFKGKVLQIYGAPHPSSYGDINKMSGEGNHLWMIFAAIEEWAAINEVTIVYSGSYNTNGILSAINNGGCPDLAFVSHSTFPVSVNLGIVDAWTDEEYQSLCESLDSAMWVDMNEFAGKKYGVIYPWTSATMLYYNKTAFETIGVTTPKEYFLEGKWDWDALKKCMDGVSIDVHGDGVLDYVGMVSDSLQCLVPPYSIDKNGALTMDVVNSQQAWDYAKLKYEYENQKKFIISGPRSIMTNVTFPMPVMQLSDCEPYNWKHCFYSVNSFHKLEVVPAPVYKSADGKEVLASTGWTQSGMFLLKNSDEREAALSLVKYILECGQKYREMLSNGVIKTPFKGLTGASEVSKAYLKAFTKACEIRNAQLKAIDWYDPALVQAYYKFFNDPKTVNHSNYYFADYSGNSICDWFRYKDLLTEPPASSMVGAREQWKAAIDKYNAQYVYGK